MTAQPTCTNELSQRSCEGGLGEAWPSTIINTRMPGGDLANSYLRYLSWKASVCASKVSEAQQACRAGLLVLIRLAKEKQGEVRESEVLSWCFGGQEQGQHCEGALSPASLSGKTWCGSMAMAGGEEGRGGDETSSGTLGSLCPLISDVVNRPWHK